MRPLPRFPAYHRRCRHRSRDCGLPEDGPDPQRPPLAPLQPDSGRGQSSAPQEPNLIGRATPRLLSGRRVKSHLCRLLGICPSASLAQWHVGDASRNTLGRVRALTKSQADSRIALLLELCRLIVPK